MNSASRSTSFSRVAAICVLAVAVVLALGACAGKVPTDPAAMTGTVTGLVAGDGRPASISVEASGTQGQGLAIDKAVVNIPPNTQFFGPDGSAASLDSVAAIKVGTTVRVWLTGAVAESYPVQATARAVQIVGQ